jgi:hypothetical protein
MKLYKKLRPTDKVCFEAGNLAFITAKEIEKAVGCRIRVPYPSSPPKISFLKPSRPMLKQARILPCIT